ncbi:MAG: MurR/RpiR family transcriptional regulator [Alphaproteobacteria bacterium]|nr:MurR/RpiR family transcriptional regulator [Alphaproteobacteria bacterium]
MNKPEPPGTMDAFYVRLGEIEGGLPKRLRQCAQFIGRNPDRVAVSTVADLAVAAGVQPSAFIRFCQELGFRGFSDMQKLFRHEYAKKWPDYSTRLNKLRARGANSASALLAEFVEAGRASLENLMHSLDAAALDRAVSTLGGANIIHLGGYGRAFPVATYLSHAFEHMSIRSVLHSGVGNLASLQLLAPGDALIAITFAPYSAKTVDLARAATQSGVNVVAITDLRSSPLVQFDPAPLLVSEIDVGAFRPLSATLSLAIALAVSVGASRKLV